MKTNVIRLRGALPGPVTWLRDCLEDGAACLDDDALNDQATLEAFDEALANDGVIDLEEALRIRRHLLLDQELTRVSGSLNHHGNRAFCQVLDLVNALRSSRAALTSGSTHTPAA